jgi:hypothetical protein
MAQSKNINTVQILNIGILIAAFLAGKKLLEFFGVIKTKEEKEQEVQKEVLEEGSSKDQTQIQTKSNLALTPNYFTTIIKFLLSKNPKFKTQTKEQQSATIKNYLKLYIGDVNTYLNYAKDIYSANKVWFLPDTEEKVFGVFRLLKSQMQISYLTYRFYELYKIDLLNYIKTFMNTRQLAQVQTIIKNKPLYAMR